MSTIFSKAVASILVAGLLSAQAVKASSLEEGDVAWSHRADGFVETGTLRREPTDHAVQAYERAVAESPDQLIGYFKLMEALYFQGFSLRRIKKCSEKLTNGQ